MDQDTRKAIMKEVRKSVVRICFNWLKEEEKKGKEFMVIAGIILSINADGSAVIAADATFFKEKKYKFVVNFPNQTGYEEPALDVSYESVEVGEYFCTFTLKPRESVGYIEPVKFETQLVNDGDSVDAFVFPREGYVTPAGYCRGSIICKISESVLFHNCKMHEYGYLGSPVFNLCGNLVGMTYIDKGHLQAWTVKHLLDFLVKNKNRYNKIIKHSSLIIRNNFIISVSDFWNSRLIFIRIVPNSCSSPLGLYPTMMKCTFSSSSSIGVPAVVSPYSVLLFRMENHYREKW